MPKQNTDQHGNPSTPYVHPTDYCYFVKLPAVLDGQYHYFRFDDYGTPQATYKAAIAYRDRTLPPSHKGRVIRHDAGNDTGRGLREVAVTTLGKPGVSIRGLHNGQYKNARVWATTRGGNHTRTFSIDRYGLVAALRYGLRQRLKWERLLYAHYSRISENDWLEFMLLCYEQHGNEKVHLGEIKHPGTISHPNPSGLQARLMVRRQQFSAWFTYREYSSRHEAHIAAILWCINTRKQHNPSGGYRVMQATRRNTSTGVAGVSRTVTKDRRGKYVIAYQANVKNDKGKRSPINFVVGRVETVTPAQEALALEIATRCRKAYEAAHDAGYPFERRP